MDCERETFTGQDQKCGSLRRVAVGEWEEEVMILLLSEEL